MVTEITSTASVMTLVLFLTCTGQNYTNNQQYTLPLGTEDLVMREKSI